MATCGHRAGEVGERGGRVRLPEAELLLLDEAEVRRLHERHRELVDALLAGEIRALEPASPTGWPRRRSFQASASMPPGRSTRAISRERDVVVEPVEGLPAHHHVDRARAHRDVLRGGHDVPDRNTAGQPAPASARAGRWPARRARRGAGPRSACRSRRRARGPSSVRTRSSSRPPGRGRTGERGRRHRPPGRRTVAGALGCRSLIVRPKLPDSLPAVPLDRPVPSRVPGPPHDGAPAGPPGVADEPRRSALGLRRDA